MLNKKQKIAAQIVKDTPFNDYRFEVAVAFIEFFKLTDKTWTDKKEIEFRKQFLS